MFPSTSVWSAAMCTIAGIMLPRGYTFGTGDAIIKGGRYDDLLQHFGMNAPCGWLCSSHRSAVERLKPSEDPAADTGESLYDPL